VRPYLLIALGVAGGLWALTRTQRGADIAADTVGAVVNALTPRGIRNNNPGNIDWIANPASRWRGMIRKETAADVPPGVTPRFGVFDTAQNGVRAIGGELRASVKKGQTIEQAIHEWAPPVENDTGLYVRLVASAVGASPQARLTDAHVLPATLEIILHEQGKQPYNVADVARWIVS
jgi:hypothetical protein